MIRKTLKSVKPGKTFKINGSTIRYIVIYKEELKVCCIVVGGHPESIGKETTFQLNMTVNNVKNPDKTLLASLKRTDSFVVKDPNNPKTCLFQKLVNDTDNKIWICEGLFPKKSDTLELPVSTSVIKVG